MVGSVEKRGIIELSFKVNESNTVVTKEIRVPEMCLFMEWKNCICPL